MKIILEGDEARAHLDQKIREAILEQTSRLPAKFELPEGCKLRPMPLSKEQKATILEMYASGMLAKDIARELHLPGMQVSGTIQGHLHPIKENVQATIDRESAKMHAELHQEPKTEGLQPTHPIVMLEAEKPPIKPTCSSCGKPLSRDKVAIDGKMYCGQGCAPKKVPVMQTKRPRPPKSNSEIDSLIIDVSAKNQDPLDIANEINRVFGGTWGAGDVTRRLKELRT